MSEIICKSQITHVAVYARGAIVTRRITLPETLPEGELTLLIEKITPLAEPGSIKTTLEGEREVVGLRSQLLIPPAPVDPSDLLIQLKTLRLEKEKLETERQEKEKRLVVLQSLLPSPTRKERWRSVDPVGTIEDSLCFSQLIVDLITSLDQKLLDIQEALHENTRAQESADLKASQAQSSELIGKNHPTRQLRIDLSSTGSVHSIEFVYLIEAARWWPAYTARLSDKATKASFSIEAFIAQASGEDWSEAMISIVTADLIYDARLPELPSLRLGRVQAPRSKGYRPPPAGLDTLFEGYERSMSRFPAPKVQGFTDEGQLVEVGEDADTLILERSLLEADTLDLEEPLETLLEDQTEFAKRKKEGFGGAQDKQYIPGAADTGSFPVPPPQAAPQAAPEIYPPMASRAPSKSSSLLGSIGGLLSFGGDGGYQNPASFHAPPTTKTEINLPIEPKDAWLDFDSLRLGEAKDPKRRGKLYRKTDAKIAQLAPLRHDIDEMEEPFLSKDPQSSRGQFDARYDASGPCSIPSDAQAHRIVLQVNETDATPMFRTVPGQTEEIYRQVELSNPFDVPLLAGPVDIFLDGALVTTSRLYPVDRGGLLQLGLGTEERIRVARNVRFSETNAGILGGTSILHHTVSIEITSALGFPALIQVLDRYPVSTDKTVDIKLLSSSPKHTPYDQSEIGKPLSGGLLWKIEINAGDSAKIQFSYQIEIPSKNEVIGGNRRD